MQHNVPCKDKRPARCGNCRTCPRRGLRPRLCRVQPPEPRRQQRICPPELQYPAARPGCGVPEQRQCGRPVGAAHRRRGRGHSDMRAGLDGRIVYVRGVRLWYPYGAMRTRSGSVAGDCFRHGVLRRVPDPQLGPAMPRHSGYSHDESHRLLRPGPFAALSAVAGGGCSDSHVACVGNVLWE